MSSRTFSRTPPLVRIIKKLAFDAMRFMRIIALQQYSNLSKLEIFVYFNYLHKVVHAEHILAHEAHKVADVEHKQVGGLDHIEWGAGEELVNGSAAYKVHSPDSFEQQKDFQTCSSKWWISLLVTLCAKAAEKGNESATSLYITTVLKVFLF